MPTDASPEIRILIVDDVEHVRQSLRQILHLSQELTVIGEASNGLEAIKAAETLKPDVVLMDLEMPVLGGLEATRRIKDKQPEIGIVIVTIHGSQEDRERAIKAGSDAFVVKEAPTEQLIAAICHVGPASEPNAKGVKS